MPDLDYFQAPCAKNDGCKGERPQGILNEESDSKALREASPSRRKSIDYNRYPYIKYNDAAQIAGG